MSKKFSKNKLIDIEEYERLKQKEIRDYNPLINMMSKIRIDLENILASKKISESAKILKIGQLKTLFAKLSQEYSPTPLNAPAPKQTTSVSLATETEKPLPDKTEIGTSEIEESSEIDDAKTEKMVEKEEKYPVEENKIDIDCESMIIAKTHKSKLLKLLQVIRDSPRDNFSVNDKGEITVFRNHYPGSNFNELMKNLYVPSSDTKLTGNNAFFRYLQSLDVPSSQFNNTKVIDEYDNPRDSQVTKSKLKAKISSLSKPNNSSSLSVSIPTDKYIGKRNKKQSGKGLFEPPGKRPKLLLVYH